jgi:recombination protein RecR
MSDRIDELAQAFTKLPGIGPRQAKRFVYYLLAAPAADRTRLAELITSLAREVRQCPECLRFFNSSPAGLCNYCADTARDNGTLMLIEKDQDLAAVERAGSYKGRYFVLGGVLTLSGKGAIREKELIKTVTRRSAAGLTEIVLALSATSEGEHTADHVRELLRPFAQRVRISELGRGLATGTELEYSDPETLRAALQNRREA